MFRASSAHLQEDTVVYMQHMVLSLCKEVSGRVLLKHVCMFYLNHIAALLLHKFSLVFL